MPMSLRNNALHLTEEEAFALLGLCMTSTERVDGVSQEALKKLADFCKTHVSGSEPGAISQPIDPSV
jgi:hypothetical protein